MEKSTFFNSVSGDRKYNAEDMASHFAKLVKNGVYPSGTQLKASEDTGMSVIVSAGSAWINGYAYHNDDDFTLTLDAADGVLNRIDRIVVRWDRIARAINLQILKGTPASAAAAPVIVRSADYYDLSIATICVAAGTTAIMQAMITDTRLDTTVCGVVSSLIQPDTSGWFDQFESAFSAWFATIEDVLGENTAGNLLNLINAQSAALTDHEEAADPHDQYVLDSELAVLQDEVTAHTADYLYETAGGTATAITLTNLVVENGHPKTFIASANNNSAATTINTKSLYKPNTTTVPKLIAGKAYTVWYDSGDDCFFIKASAEGTASTGHVLAGFTFSNDVDTGLTGAMPNRGVFNLGLGVSVPPGYYSGGTTMDGKRWASGSTVVSSFDASITIAGLSFTANTIVAEYSHSGTLWRQSYRLGFSTSLNRYFYATGSSGLTLDPIINSTGFKLYVNANFNDTVNWYAYE